MMPSTPHITPGAGANWGQIISAIVSIASIFASSEHLKTGIVPPPGGVDELAREVYGLPVSTWRYLWDEPGRRRVGPMLEAMPPYMREDQHRFDPVSVLGSLIATAQSQDRRLRRLEGQ